MSDPESKAQRVRTLLAGYYGHAQSSASPSSLQQRVPSVPPIDAPDFDPETWVCDTLRDTSLGQLSVKCQQMKREAVALNGESQMLVYENYSKFIAATDTVRDVAKNVVEMEGKMAQLKQQMLLTTEKAQAVDKNLGIRREQVEQLSGVRSLISKLQAAFEVPRKMETALDVGAVTLAVSYYSAIAPLLAKYGGDIELGTTHISTKSTTHVPTRTNTHVSPFVDVKKAADTQKGVAVEMLIGKMAAAATRGRAARETRRNNRDDASETSKKETDNPEDPTQTATSKSSHLTSAECVCLLEKLGVAREASRVLFAKSHLTCMEGALAMAARHDTSGSVYPPPSADPRGFVEKLDREFLEAFHQFADEFNALFPDGDSKNYLTVVSKKLFSLYFAILKKALDVSTVVPPDSHETSVDTKGNPEPTGPKLVDAKGLMAALAVMAADLSGAHRLVPRVGLGDRASEVVERAVRGRVTAAFLDLEASLVDAIREAEEIASGGGNDLRSAGERVCLVFAGGIAQSLTDCQNLLEERPVMVQSWRLEFEGLVKARSKEIVENVLQRLVAGTCVCGETETVCAYDDERSPLADASRDAATRFANGFRDTENISLAAVTIANFVASEGIDCITNLLQKCFPRRSGGDGNDEWENDLRAKASSASVRVASEFTKTASGRITSLIRRTTVTTNWREAREPRVVRPVMDAVADEIDGINAACAAAGLLDDVSQSASADDPGMRKQSATTVHDTSPFTPAECTRDVLTATVVAAVLKSWQEIIAGLTLSKGGYHQMELDFAFLEAHLVTEKKVGASGTGALAKAIRLLLEECRDTAASRSVDGTPLDPAIVTRILSAKGSRGGSSL